MIETEVPDNMHPSQFGIRADPFQGLTPLVECFSGEIRGWFPYLTQELIKLEQNDG
jgi:hypothetical protein